MEVPLDSFSNFYSTKSEHAQNSAKTGHSALGLFTRALGHLMAPRWFRSNKGTKRPLHCDYAFKENCPEMEQICQFQQFLRRGSKSETGKNLIRGEKPWKALASGPTQGPLLSLLSPAWDALLFRPRSPSSEASAGSRARRGSGSLGTKARRPRSPRALKKI